MKEYITGRLWCLMPLSTI